MAKKQILALIGEPEVLTVSSVCIDGVICMKNGKAVFINNGNFVYIGDNAKPCGRIKIFNLTTLRKHGFKFDDGKLMYSGEKNIYLAGKWLNTIDAELDVIAETEYDIFVRFLGSVYPIDKVFHNILYKNAK